MITGRAGDFSFYTIADQLPAAFPLLDVKYLLVPARMDPVPDGFELAYDGEIAVYRNTRVLDRALVVLDHEVEPDDAALLARVRSGTFDPSAAVLLEAPPPPTPAHVGVVPSPYDLRPG